MSPGLVKLAISPCTVEDNGDIVVRSSKFEAMLNPESYSHAHAISYDQKTTLGQLAPEPKFSGYDGEEVTFDLVLDGTGVVPTQPGDVKSQVKDLSAIVYDYDGSNHEPNVVRLLWGSLLLFARLKSMTMDYTLFTPGGDPLRAKVKMSFVRFMSRTEESLRASRSSPDLSHQVVVQAGDTLPALCHRIYRDAGYYTEVARFNGLASFRSLSPGDILRFPPLRPAPASGSPEPAPATATGLPAASGR